MDRYKGPGINNRKRTIRIIDILQRKTDASYGMTLSEIVVELTRYFGNDFTTTFAAIREDIQSIRDCGIQIDEDKQSGKATHYKWTDHKFDLYELRVMIDAVASSYFLTVEDSEKFIEKIKTLTSENQAKRLGNRLFVDGHIKTKSKSVKFYIGDLHETILDRNKITFQYRKFNVSKELDLHRNGFQYVVNPYALVWNRDHYYLIAHQAGIDEIKTFRVDRLYRLERIDEQFEDPHFNVARYINQTFNMYPGETASVRVKFQNSLLNVVIDRFGEEVSLYPFDDHSFIIVIDAAVSAGLVRWLMTWGADAQVLAPQGLIERMRDESVRMAALYTEA